MRQMLKIFVVLTTCFGLAGAAAARTGKEIAVVFDSGVVAYDAGNYEQAFKIWWGLQYEDIAAMRNVAMMLRKGQGTTRDPRRAVTIYERAAEAGLPTAQADLADMLLKGEAGEPDPKAALPLLQAAAAANHPLAQFQLAQMFETGAGGLVPLNLDVARQLYASAAARGMKEAAERLSVIGPSPNTPPPAPTGAPATQATLSPPPPAAQP
jgi:TPR repeat protein